MFLKVLLSVLVLALFQLQQTAAVQSIQDISQLFRSTQLVPDLLPSFNPSVLLDGSFAKEVVPGQSLSKNDTQSTFLMAGQSPLTPFVDTANPPSLALQRSTNATKFVILMVCTLHGGKINLSGRSRCSESS